MAENLKLENTLQVDGIEYDINAVYSDKAGKVTNQLIVKESGEEVFGFDGGTSGQIIDYIPTDKGGTYKGPIFLDHSTSTPGSKPADNEVITSAQVSNRVVNLNGAPICAWNTALSSSDLSGSLYSLTDDTDKLYRFTTLTGTESDFYILKSLLSGENESTGSSTLSYTLNYNPLSTILNHWMTGNLSKDASGAIIIKSGEHTGKHTYTYLGETKTITYSGFITEISSNTFAENKNITNVIMPNTITLISDAAFKGCTGLRDITVSEKVTAIKAQTFSNCSGLNSIVIPKSVTSVEENAFDGCTSLKTVYYTGNADDWAKITISSVNNGALSNATIKYNYAFTEGITSIGTKIDISTISKGPFIYMCKDDESTNTPASNKLFLKLPDSTDIVEISKGATRLNSTNNVGQSYYTYEGLAEIIARINTRLDGLGVGVNQTALPTAPLYSVDDVNKLVPDVEITESFAPEHIPTIIDLTKAIVNIIDRDSYKDVEWNTENLDALTLLTEAVSNLKESLTDTYNEIMYENNDGYIANTRLDDIKSGKTSLDKVKIGDTTLTEENLKKLLALLKENNSDDYNYYIGTIQG